MFRPVQSPVSFPKLEEEIIQFWKERGIYEKSLAARSGGPAFVFFEGPPTANGLPHPGHCLTRSIKDLFPRYRTMRGYRCERKAGWDTHGLPVEVEVCKELGIHAKDEIEAFGVEPFVHKCLESVFRYTKQWEQLTERLGFWIHLDDAYVTYHQSYVESVWWALKNLFERGLLYQGHKIVWWWAQGGTALSSGEVGQGYREVADPSVYVRFPLVDEPDTDLLVWTTTPWTLPSNQFAAVKPDLEYSAVEVEGQVRKLVLATALVDAIAAKIGKKLKVVSTFKGEELVGKRYRPPFDYYWKTQAEIQGRLKEGARQHVAWRVLPADFVTIDAGTGVVHQAPAFGEVDFDLLLAEQARFADGEGPPLLCAVGPDGKFTAEAPDYAGRWVKDADRDIMRRLRAEGTLLHQEQYLHDYPFFLRADEDPLIQYPRKSWFIRTTRFRDKMLANNRRIGWLPEHIRDGRFGNFLETNVDWALSRERYWGTPLPIWVCEKTGYMEAVASYAELLAKPGVEGAETWQEAKRANPGLAEHLKVHKPYIDAITYNSPKAPGKRMRRVGEVVDCWFDAGAMPFAQWGYPSQPGSRERLAGQFPADFISEALDQTRGWFYSLLAISTLLFRDGEGEPTGERSDEFSRSDTPALPYPHPYRNCVVLGLMLGEDGQKMSKSKRNYREPSEIFDRYGADAMRWYFFANQPSWTSIRYNEAAIKESIPEFLLRLWNVYSFFVIYANIDRFDPAAEIAGNPRQLGADVLASAAAYRPIAERGELDRWVLSELNRTATGVVAAMDAYDNFGACQRLTEFVERAVELVRAPQPRSLLERRRFGRQDRRLLDPLRVSVDHGETDRPVRPFPCRDPVAEPGRGAVLGPAGRKRPSLRLPARRGVGGRRGSVAADGAGAGDRLPGPRRSNDGKAESAAAAAFGRDRALGGQESRMARRARRLDPRRAQREERRVYRTGGGIHQLPGAPRFEAAWTAAGTASAHVAATARPDRPQRDHEDHGGRGPDDLRVGRRPCRAGPGGSPGPAPGERGLDGRPGPLGGGRPLDRDYA